MLTEVLVGCNPSSLGSVIVVDLSRLAVEFAVHEVAEGLNVVGEAVVTFSPGFCTRSCKLVQTV